MLRARNVTDEVSPTSFQRLKIRLNGHAKIGYTRKAGWKEQVPLFAFNCEAHGVVSNTPQGHMQRLLCPRCFNEEIASALDVQDQMQQSEMHDTSIAEGN